MHILFEHDSSGKPHSTAYIRLLLPLRLLSAEHGLVVTAGLSLPAERVDVVIVDRLWRGWGCEKSVAHLLSVAAREGIKIVHAIDDALYDLQSEHLLLGYPSSLVLRLTYHANQVVVTTPLLAERVSRINGNVTIIENVIDPVFLKLDRQPKPPQGKKITIGYMGSYTHLEDLRMIAQPLRRFAATSQSPVEFHLVGIGDGSKIEAMLGEFCKNIVPPQGASYTEFMHWLISSCAWDIGIAPLRDTAFNSFKSDIKWLDYAALGVPGIFSNVPAYARTVRSGSNGVLADATSESWFGALTTLSKSETTRKIMAAQARSEIVQNRLLEHAAQKWRVLLNDV